jgi:DNA-binding PadR family transcriptional regulator
LITDTLRGMRDPLREPTFMILTALAPGPLHGYAIIGEVAELSGGRLTLRPGTLYGALDRLGEEGLLEPDHEEVVDGRLRRYYRLSDDGAAVLEHEAARLQHNADAARGRLARRPTRRAGPAGPVLPGVVPRPAGGLA